MSTNTSNAEDIRALRDFLGGQRRGLTLHTPDVLTGEMLHVHLGDVSGLEAWSVRGDPGICARSSRETHLVDDVTETPISTDDRLIRAIWRDEVGKEHESRLSGKSLRRLRSSIEDDDAGDSELLLTTTIAEPLPLVSTLWTIARR